MIMDGAASLFILSGLYLYGRKHLAGPVLSMAGCFLWFITGLTSEMYVLAILNAILFMVNAYNAVIWSSQSKLQSRGLIPPSDDESDHSLPFHRRVHRP
jgi:hypothetical protein